jgi:hypothetical protein
MAEKIGATSAASTSNTAPPPTPMAPAPTTPTPPPMAGSVVNDAAEGPRKKKNKKRKKKRYSDGTRDAQKLASSFGWAAGRIANAVSVGLETYNQEAGRSGNKKRDGAVRDALVNASMGIGDAMQELSRAPSELARGIPSGLMWRQMRSFARVVMPPQ